MRDAASSFLCAFVLKSAFMTSGERALNVPLL